MTDDEKKDVIMQAFGLSEAMLKTMTTPDKDNKRLNKLFDKAQDMVNEEVDAL